jgi:hypothetical protein
MAKKPKLAEGYYDPSDYVLVHKKYFAKLKALLEEPELVDAVDPPAPLRESRPRATETLPTASRGGGDTRPPRADQDEKQP